MRIRLTVVLCCLLLCACAARAETPLRIATLNAEWLCYTEDETTKDPWGRSTPSTSTVSTLPASSRRLSQTS